MDLFLILYAKFYNSLQPVVLVKFYWHQVPPACFLGFSVDITQGEDIIKVKGSFIHGKIL